METLNILQLNVRNEEMLALTPLLREGVTVRLTPGRTLRQSMTEDLGIAPDCVEQRVQTVFLDGSPVDDIDADSAEPGCTLALAGALPGVAGIAMRRNSPVGAFRQGITHCLGHQEPAPPASGSFEVTLKLFNSVALECLGTVLGRGVAVRAARLLELLEDAEVLAGATFALGTPPGPASPVDRAALLAALRGLPGLIRLVVLPAGVCA